MEHLLIKSERNPSVSKADFLNNVNCLFGILKGAYGLYDYWGETSFFRARQKLANQLERDPFSFSHAVSSLKQVFSEFVRDGHFEIDPVADTAPDPGFAVRETVFHGIPMIQCRKFYFDSPAEKQELERFSASFPKYRNADSLILDLRDNDGGSDLYIWNFLTGLFGAEPDYPCLFVQRYSPLFQTATGTDKNGTASWESDGVRIKSQKKIYVLINEKTASSAESAVAYLKTCDSATIVGTHTAGCFTCGNCITVYLPHSHIPVYFGTGMVLYEKTRNIDAEGGFQADMTYDDFLKHATQEG